MSSRTREGCCARQDEETWYSLHGFDGAGDEGGRAFGDGVVDADSRSFVEDLDAEDLGRAHGAVFVGAGEGDVEGQDLVGVHRGGQFVHAVDVGHLGVELVDGVADRLAVVAHDARGEQGIGIRGVQRELRTDVVRAGDAGATCLGEEVEQGRLWFRFGMSPYSESQ